MNQRKFMKILLMLKHLKVSTRPRPHTWAFILSCRVQFNLQELIMTELLGGSVYDFDSTLKWFESTFMAIRAAKNYAYYNEGYTDFNAIASNKYLEKSM